MRAWREGVSATSDGGRGSGTGRPVPCSAIRPCAGADPSIDVTYMFFPPRRSGKSRPQPWKRIRDCVRRTYRIWAQGLSRGFTPGKKLLVKGRPSRTRDGRVPTPDGACVYPNSAGVRSHVGSGHSESVDSSFVVGEGAGFRGAAGRRSFEKNGSNRASARRGPPTGTEFLGDQTPALPLVAGRPVGTRSAGTARNQACGDRPTGVSSDVRQPRQDHSSWCWRKSTSFASCHRINRL